MKLDTLVAVAHQNRHVRLDELEWKHAAWLQAQTLGLIAFYKVSCPLSAETGHVIVRIERPFSHWNAGQIAGSLSVYQG